MTNNGVINVGEVIADILKDQIMDSAGSLSFPSLITKLCKNVEVSMVGDVPIRAAPPIDVATIDRYKNEGSAALPPCAPIVPKGLLAIKEQLDQVQRTQKHIAQFLYGIEGMIHKLAGFQDLDLERLDRIPAHSGQNAYDDESEEEDVNEEHG